MIAVRVIPVIPTRPFAGFTSGWLESRDAARRRARDGLLRIARNDFMRATGRLLKQRSEARRAHIAAMVATKAIYNSRCRLIWEAS